MFFLFSAEILCASPAPEQAEQASEDEVKAAFLYNFAKFVEWPSDAFGDSQAPIVLGILGNHSFAELLAGMVAEKRVNGRKLFIHYLKPGEDVRKCHILFVGSSAKKSLPLILDSVRGLGVLTVGETKRFAEWGGIINLVVQENRVRFEVNAEAAMHARLTISSKVLALARIVTSLGRGRS